MNEMSDTEEPLGGEPRERAAEAGTAERLQALEAELGEAKDKLLRALAETENVRRRAQREREDAARYGAANFARDMLTVADNLRRALEHAPQESAQDEVTRSLIAGVAATERELQAALERHGVRKIEPKPGDRFDHNLHEAMFEVETGQPAGLIVQVLQPGYVIHDRLLRPAMVGVAKATGAPEAKRVDEVV
jgi:molecular chaperone GrpE